ncbi:hypothetical protein FHX35_000786 [Auritidibacter ignavus]|nr:hypothetical protein [Auritidibacter ignavus]
MTYAHTLGAEGGRDEAMAWMSFTFVSDLWQAYNDFASCPLPIAGLGRQRRSSWRKL